MLPICFLKRRFPNSPDWLIGGLLFIGAFWVIVLPLEAYNISVSDVYYFPNSDLEFIAKAFYLKGYVISTSWTPVVQRLFEADQTVAFVMMLLGMLISSPGYFLTGALLATRKAVVVISGIVLVLINMLINYFLYIGLIILTSG